jgi:cardiolipin synthase (CMP-forming)
MSTLANKLTVTRLILTPVFAGFVVWHQQFGGGEQARFAAMGCFAAAATLDAVDGYIARHFNQCTPLGAWLDPLADKLLLFSGLTLLTFWGAEADRLRWWLWGAVTLRDALLGLGAAVLWRRYGKVQVRPRWTGKVATLMQTGGVLIALSRIPEGVRTGWSAVAAGITVVSGLQYLVDGLRQGLARPLKIDR